MQQEVLEDIIAASKTKNLTAFRQLVDHFQPYAFAIALRVLCDEEDAKDVTQESFVRVWRHLKKYDSRAKFSTWLYKIVTNLCFDCLKNKARQKRIMRNDLGAASTIAGETDLEQQTINSNLTDVVRKLIDDLTPQQRIVFVLRDFEDLEISEVATILNISPGSVKSNLYHARKQIRENLVAMEKIKGA
ncbi:MAG: RNA polymerase sigma factor [bacterium]